MNAKHKTGRLIATAAAISWLFGSSDMRAHCDGLDGPVVEAARQSLASSNVNLVLIWVQKADEMEIRNTFNKTLAVRALSAEAKELADIYFFETVVRIHRAGEGAPYTGLKPAGRDLGPMIPAADKALKEGKVEPLVHLLTEHLQESVRQKFDKVVKKKNFAANNVTAGREYVAAYVEFIHAVEALYEQAGREAHGHFAEPAEKSHQHETTPHDLEGPTK